MGQRAHRDTCNVRQPTPAGRRGRQALAQAGHAPRSRRAVAGVHVVLNGHEICAKCTRVASFMDREIAIIGIEGIA